MARWIAWLGLGLLVAGIVLGTFALGTNAFCSTKNGTPHLPLAAGYRFGHAFDEGPCAAIVIPSTIFFLGGIVLLGVTSLQKQIPPPSS